MTFLRAFAVISVCLITFASGAKAGDAEGTVSQYHNQLQTAIADPSNDDDQSLFDALAPVMDVAFDFETMTKTIVGRQWAKADLDTQSRLLAAFRRVSIATYADQFSDLKQGEFEIVSSRDGPRGLKLVDSRLKTPDDNVSLVYVLRNKNGAWRIIDVLLDGGISELAVRASEYSNILKNSGPEGLIASLNKQSKDLLAN